jgi:hypothetical protein
MNKKIKELIKQMGGIRYDDDNEEMTLMLIDKELETFAELIVKECARLASEHYDKYDCIHGQDILDHFGIK